MSNYTRPPQDGDNVFRSPTRLYLAPSLSLSLSLSLSVLYKQ